MSSSSASIDVIGGCVQTFAFAQQTLELAKRIRPRKQRPGRPSGPPNRASAVSGRTFEVDQLRGGADKRHVPQVGDPAAARRHHHVRRTAASSSVSASPAARKYGSPRMAKISRDRCALATLDLAVEVQEATDRAARQAPRRPSLFPDPGKPDEDEVRLSPDVSRRSRSATCER